MVNTFCLSTWEAKTGGSSEFGTCLIYIWSFRPELQSKTIIPTKNIWRKMLFQKVYFTQKDKVRRNNKW